MPKSVSVTVTMTFAVEVPKSWRGEALENNVANAIAAFVTSTAKNVKIGDVDIETAVEEEE